MQEELGLLESHVVFTHFGERDASGIFCIARRPVVLDVATSEEDTDEECWRETYGY